jgi:DNA-nicking Smr family endonuclease
MTHARGGKPGKAGRQVTEDEADLWRQLTHSVGKVKTKPRVTAHGAEPAAPASASTAPGAPGRLSAAQSRVRTARAAPAAPPPPKPPVPTELDRRTVRQVAAGKVPIDAVLDLHGLHQAAAYARLRAFLVSSQANGHRMVLVITGKGGGVGPLAPDLASYRRGGGEGSDPDAVPRGVLRRSLPQWLEEPELRAVVLSYAAAGVRHGGVGALYVRLRKARGA